MTTPGNATHVHRGDQLVAAIPHLVGFWPTECLVVVWFVAARVVLTQRADLLDEAGRREVLAGRAQWLPLPSWVVDHADAVAFVVCCESDTDLVAVLPVVDRLGEQLASSGIAVRDLVHVRSGRCRSVHCAGPCCPPAGRAVPQAVVEAAQVAFAFDGRAVLPDRFAVVAQVGPDPVAIAEVSAEVSAGLSERPHRGDDWRDAAITDVLGVLLGRPGPVPARCRADVLRALADVRVRDTVLWELARVGPDPAAAATNALASLVRSAPQTLCAPVATCCAVAAWLTGDGTLAGAAVDRALAAEPDYGLATLVATALRAGWPPSAWRSIIGQLDRQTCRRGLLP